MKRGEYHEKMRQWEGEGYDVSEFKQKWFPEGEGTGKGRAWMPRAAGILDLVAGIPGLIGGIGLGIGGMIAPTLWPLWDAYMGYIAGLSIPLIILSTVAIVGGVFAIRKRAWGFALAAAICAFIVGMMSIGSAIVLGIPAIVFTVLGRSRFK